MLASPAESVDEALESFGEAAFELKLDGARIQVHKSGDEVRVFSRALRDVTAAVPEVVDAVGRCRSREIILDGEVLALAATARRCRFRKRCADSAGGSTSIGFRTELPLTPFFFDCLYIDGRPLTAQPNASVSPRSSDVTGALCRSASNHRRPERPQAILRDARSPRATKG